MIAAPTHRARRQRRTPPCFHRGVRPAAIVLLAVLSWSTPDVDAAAAPANVQQTTPAAEQQIDQTLAALDRLHAYGYTINTPARATRAIRHWQHANRLTVDGHIGPETLASLGLDRSGATAPAPVPLATPVPAADPETAIRQVWPDDLEDRAVAIAMRESSLVPSARNSCCYGLFQIHFQAHRHWLAGIGITSPNQLLDAGTNTRAAYALYQLDGWTPWAL